jgi:hypothetical protein
MRNLHGYNWGYSESIHTRAQLQIRTSLRQVLEKGNPNDH